MVVTTGIEKKEVRLIIKKEIQFFDLMYFLLRDEAIIRLYYSGHGMKDRIVIREHENIYYIDIIEWVAELINDHMQRNIFKTDKLFQNQSDIEWNKNMCKLCRKNQMKKSKVIRM